MKKRGWIITISVIGFLVVCYFGLVLFLGSARLDGLYNSGITPWTSIDDMENKIDAVLKISRGNTNPGLNPLNSAKAFCLWQMPDQGIRIFTSQNGKVIAVIVAPNHELTEEESDKIKKAEWRAYNTQSDIKYYFILREDDSFAMQHP